MLILLICDIIVGFLQILIKIQLLKLIFVKIFACKCWDPTESVKLVFVKINFC